MTMPSLDWKGLEADGAMEVMAALRESERRLGQAQQEIAQAMAMVARGLREFERDRAPDVSAYAVPSASDRAPGSKPVLTDRDRLVLKLITAGLRNKEIAEELGVTRGAVDSYRSRLMSKLGYSSPAELVRFAIRQGLIRP